MGIVALAGADENERRAPTAKAGTYLAAGLLVLASDLPGIRSVVGVGPHVEFVSPQSVEAWKEAFRRIAAMSDEDVARAKGVALETARLQSALSSDEIYVQVFRDAVSLQPKAVQTCAS